MVRGAPKALARGLLQATGTVGRTSKFVVPSCLRFVEHGRDHFFQRRPVQGLASGRQSANQATSTSEVRDVRFEVRYHEGVSEMGGWLVCARSLGLVFLKGSWDWAGPLQDHSEGARGWLMDPLAALCVGFSVD